MDHCFPEYDVWTQFINTDLGRALELDALDNSHPIEVRCVSCPLFTSQRMVIPSK